MTIINIYAPNRGEARYTSQLLTGIKGHIDKNTLIVGDLNTQLSAIDRSPKQKINKETRVLNDILDQMDLIDIYRTLHPSITEYSFFPNAHGISPEQTIYQATKQVSTDTKRLRLFPAYSRTTML